MDQRVMQVVATSDLHGVLPTIPRCDLLLIAGDVCPYWNHDLVFQEHWLRTDFNMWLKKVPARKVVMTPGNHDWLFERAPDDVPELACSVLIDEQIEFEGYTIFGTPWQRRFHNWAFNLDQRELDDKYRKMPKSDIIVAHGPPYGFGDLTEREYVGSKGFVQRIIETEPILVVFGHIHTGYGTWRFGSSSLANVSLLNDEYQQVNKPRKFKIHA